MSVRFGIKPRDLKAFPAGCQFIFGEKMVNKVPFWHTASQQKVKHSEWKESHRGGKVAIYTKHTGRIMESLSQAARVTCAPLFCGRLSGKCLKMFRGFLSQKSQ